MFDFVICALTNLFRIFLVDRFVSIFLGKMEEKKNIKLVVCVCFFVINTALFWKYRTAWINIFSNLMGICAITMIYSKSVKAIIFVTCSVYLINCGCDVAVYSLFTDYQDGQAYNQVYAVVVLFLILMCELLTEKLITIHKSAETAQNFPLILVPLCSIAVIWVFLYGGVHVGRETAIMCVGLMVINFLMLYLYNLLLRSVSQKYETRMLEQKVRMYANQLDVIRQNEEKIKILRHDMKHHMNEIRLLADKYHAVEIGEYIDCMKQSIQNSDEIVSSGNVEIDSVLNYMLQKARDKLDNVIVKVVLPEKMRHTFDMNVLIGNLLENAIEAAVQTERKYLKVTMVFKKGVLKIRMENSFLSAETENGERQERRNLHTTRNLLTARNLFTTKKEKEQHGFGLKSVEKVVEAYNGTMEVMSQKDVFCVNLILYMPES